MDGGKRARDSDGGVSGSKRHAAVPDSEVTALAQLWATAADHRLRDKVRSGSRTKHTKCLCMCVCRTAHVSMQQQQQGSGVASMIELELKCGVTNSDGSFLPDVGQVLLPHSACPHPL